ncbi:zinc finger protein JACKDAW-like [Olea europaea var. sylvestris]|uniref:zinc finger protein JACKDAW-like n=1 Tax=Olea europaea var. sylvestris TaxID=158386 RepID=UPI000C1D01DA|nr:zinc finger protein JACKDAW-like [Olea europaea var. sylvestris]XP_022846665.1 zinc finger protein JACKDAW-like [Olea europaea var. sylvestris]
MSVDEFSVANMFPQEPETNPNPQSNSKPTAKKKRLPGNPDPDAQVIALSPITLMATNRFICEICNKGFRRDQNLQLHRRGHNLPWKLKQRANKDQIIKKVYICPENTCVHHDPSRALGDLTGIKKHFSRKHGEKKWKCEKCSKKYAVQSDWKAHSKTCGTREYKCDCGTLFSRKDSFITHRAFCDALAEESARSMITASANKLNFRNDNLNGPMMNPSFPHGFNVPTGISQVEAVFKPDCNGVNSGNSLVGDQQKPRLSLWLDQANSHQHNFVDMNYNPSLFIPSSSTGLPDMPQMTSSFGNYLLPRRQGLMEEEVIGKRSTMDQILASLYSDNEKQQSNSSASMSASALLQRAAQMGSTRTNPTFFGNAFGVMNSSSSSSNSPNANSLAQNRSELHQVFGEQPKSFNDKARDSMMEGSNLKQTSATQSQAFSVNLHGVEHSLTRDFLGMGGEGGNPFSPQQLAKFASMSSALGLSQFSSNH